MKLKLKGMDKIREKLPDYPGRKLAWIPLRGFLAAVLGYFFLILLDILPRLFSDNIFLFVLEPYFPFIGSFVIAALITWLLEGLWSKRDQMKAEYGDLAYQRMFPRGLMGVFLLPPGSCVGGGWKAIDNRCCPSRPRS